MYMAPQVENFGVLRQSAGKILTYIFLYILPAAGGTFLALMNVLISGILGGKDALYIIQYITLPSPAYAILQMSIEHNVIPHASTEVGFAEQP